MNRVYRQMKLLESKPQAVFGNTRIIAWGCITLSLLLLKQAGAPLLALCALLGSYGVQSLLSSTAPFGLSSSTRALRKSAPVGKLIKKVQHHKAPQTTDVTGWLFAVLILVITTGLALVLQRNAPLVLLLIPCAAIYVGTQVRSHILEVLGAGTAFYLLYLDGRPQILMLGIVFTALFSLYAYSKSRWILLGATALSALFLCILLPVAVGPAYALAALFPLSLVVATRERLADERERFRQLLVPANILAILCALQSDPQWLAAPLLLNLGMAGFAWDVHKRVSYAKYFLVIAAAQLGIILFVALQSGWLVLMLLIAAVTIVAVGATIGSLTTRLSGIAALLIALLLYATLILPDDTKILLGRDGLGFLIALGLPTYASWYTSLTCKQAEQRLQHVVAEGSAAFAAILALGLSLLDTDGAARSFLLIVLALVILRLKRERGIWRTAAFTLLICGVVLLIFVNIPQRPEVGNIVASIALIVLSCVLLWQTARHTSRPSVY